MRVTVSKAKAMGTAVETAAVNWLKLNGFPQAERLPLAGSLDRGDLRLCREPTVIAECKRAQRGLQLVPWMRELEVEIGNAGATTGLLIAKQKGVGDKRVGRWVGGMSYDAFVSLYGNWLDAGKWFDVESVSPMHVNSRYIPTLGDSGEVPFARVESVRQYSRNRQQVGTVYLGPLKQFTMMLVEAGYGQEERRDGC
jgi:hypothetical protein